MDIFFEGGHKMCHRHVWFTTHKPLLNAHVKNSRCLVNERDINDWLTMDISISLYLIWRELCKPICIKFLIHNMLTCMFGSESCLFIKSQQFLYTKPVVHIVPLTLYNESPKQCPTSTVQS